MTPTFGRMREPAGWTHHVFSGVSVHAIAWHGRKVAEWRRPVQPQRKKRRDNVVADCILANPRSQGVHHAGAVSHRDQSRPAGIRAFGDAVVMVIQGTSV